MHSPCKETYIFAPGCAMILYKPDLAKKIHTQLESLFGKMKTLETCCQHDPFLPAGTKIINMCPGCNKRFSSDYPNVTTISLWELIAESSDFKFPGYPGLKASIIDACPTREETGIHAAIRTVLKKMDIELAEPAKTGTKSTCCGDSFYGLIPVGKVKELMVQRTSEMPEDDVVVYCISCVKSVYNGGKKPRYLADLLFSEETIPGVLDPDIWHKELREYIDQH